MLYIGVALYIAASVLCALSPTVELLIAARVVQGMAGGAGIVIAQAACRDIFSGSALIRYYELLSDRVFLGTVLVQGFVNAAIFAYLAGATFALQGIYGLSPQG